MSRNFRVRRPLKLIFFFFRGEVAEERTNYSHVVVTARRSVLRVPGPERIDGRKAEWNAKENVRGFALRWPDDKPFCLFFFPASSPRYLQLQRITDISFNYAKINENLNSGWNITRTDKNSRIVVTVYVSCVF